MPDLPFTRVGLRPWRWAIVALLGCVALARPARADESERAQALFEEARQLMLAGRHVEACPKLATSQSLDPAVGTLLHLAECHARTGRTATAWRTFREAIALARRLGQPDRERVALERAKALESSLPFVLIAVPPTADTTGLVILRDGEEVSRDAWGASVPVDPGPHSIVAKAPGMRSFQTQVDVPVEGGTTVVTLPLLEREEAPAISSSPTPTPSWVRPAGWVSLSVGGASLVTSMAFGVASIRAWGDARARCPQGACDEEGYNRATTAHTTATISTVLFAVGTVGIGAGAVLLYQSPSQRAAWVRPGLGGLSIEGTL